MLPALRNQGLVSDQSCIFSDYVVYCSSNSSTIVSKERVAARLGFALDILSLRIMARRTIENIAHKPRNCSTLLGIFRVTEVSFKHFRMHCLYSQVLAKFLGLLTFAPNWGVGAGSTSGGMLLPTDAQVYSRSHRLVQYHEKKNSI